MIVVNVPYICAYIHCPRENLLWPFLHFSFVNSLAFSSDWQVKILFKNIFSDKSYFDGKKHFSVTHLIFQGPPITTTTMISAKTLIANTTSANDKNIMATGPFVMRTPLLTTYAQQLWLIGRMETDNRDDEKFDKTFQMNVMIEGLTKDHKPVPLSNILRNR